MGTAVTWGGAILRSQKARLNHCQARGLGNVTSAPPSHQGLQGTRGGVPEKRCEAEQGDVFRLLSPSEGASRRNAWAAGRRRVAETAAAGPAGRGIRGGASRAGLEAGPRGAGPRGQGHLRGRPPRSGASGGREPPGAGPRGRESEGGASRGRASRGGASRGGGLEGRGLEGPGPRGRGLRGREGLEGRGPPRAETSRGGACALCPRTIPAGLLSTWMVCWAELLLYSSCTF